MSRGFLSGVIWGSASVAAGLVALSFAVPQAPAPGSADGSGAPAQGGSAPERPLASASEPETAPAPDMPASPPEAAPVVPAPKTVAEAPAPEAAPETPSVEAAPPRQTAPAPTTEAPAPDAAAPEPRATVETAIDLPAGSEFNRPPPDLPAQPPAALSGAGPAAAVPGMARPADEGAQPPQPDTAPAGAPVAEAEAPAALFAPDDLPGAAPAGPGAEDPVLPSPEALGPDAPRADTAPVVVDRSAGAVERPERAPEVRILRGAEPAEEAEAMGIRINRLPTVAADPAPAPDPAVEEAAADPAAEAEPAARAGALDRFAVPYDAPGDRPLFAVILIDAGEEGLDRASLTTFAFPVTFAVDPTRADAAEAMAAYRAAGHEVVALATGLPDGATPKEVEVAMIRHLSVLPETVAVMDPAGAELRSNRAAMRQLVSLISDTGHGLVTHDKGLNTGQQMAERAGVPATTIYRNLDDAREASPVIRRYLDRAAFQAVQDGAVVMLGHSYPETVTALYSWAQEDRASKLALVPLSAILARGR